MILEELMIIQCIRTEPDIDNKRSKIQGAFTTDRYGIERTCKIFGAIRDIITRVFRTPSGAFTTHKHKTLHRQ